MAPSKVFEFLVQNPSKKIEVVIPEYNLKTEGFLNN